MNNRPPNRRKSPRRPGTPRLHMSSRDLSIRHPALTENIRRFRVIHQSAARQALIPELNVAA